MPAISVLTLVKGRRDHLRYLIEGLARSAEPPGELIIVNMDPAPLKPARYSFPITVTDLPATATLPLGAARNAAAAAAQHHLLLFLDVDCIVTSRSLGLISRAIQRQDAMLAPEILYLPAHAVTPDWREGPLRRKGHRHPVRRFPDSGELREFNPGFLWGVAFAMRARTFDRLGGFDKNFAGYGAEDTDLGFRGNEAGLPLIYLGGAPILHQHHPIYTPALNHFADVVRNASLFFSKWGIWPMLDRLDGYEKLGLIERTETHLRILRYPTPAEIAASLQPYNVLF